MIHSPFGGERGAVTRINPQGKQRSCDILSFGHVYFDTGAWIQMSFNEANRGSSKSKLAL